MKGSVNPRNNALFSYRLAMEKVGRSAAEQLSSSKLGVPACVGGGLAVNEVEVSSLFIGRRHNSAQNRRQILNQ